jgi:2-phospho-L-lactate transferase/gluconeogenesis factor (CofD/UPF0052 family)
MGTPRKIVPGIENRTCCAIRSEASSRRLAVSPFIGGEAVKGPVAKILRELGKEPSAAYLARRYDGIVDMIIHDLDDAAIRRTPHGLHRSYAGASKR